MVTDKMINNDTKRLSRLTSILLQLQSKRMVTATMLAEKFNVSTRTIYRDIKALEQSGVPVLTDEGKGYYLMKDYRIPPVAFTESEANALITAQKLVGGNSDSSFLEELEKAIDKVKAVLRHSTKENTELLTNRMAVSKSHVKDVSSRFVPALQSAVTHYNLTKIDYRKENEEVSVLRTVEPFALLTTQNNWILLAWCRLRKDFRFFRIDRIIRIEVLNEQFQPHKMTLQEYFERH